MISWLYILTIYCLCPKISLYIMALDLEDLYDHKKLISKYNSYPGFFIRIQGINAAHQSLPDTMVPTLQRRAQPMEWIYHHHRLFVFKRDNNACVLKISWCKDAKTKRVVFEMICKWSFIYLFLIRNSSSTKFCRLVMLGGNLNIFF